MKKILFLLLTAITLTAFTGCSKDDNGGGAIDKVNAKWNVSGSSEYVSFEFNASGNYIITKTDDTKAASETIVLFGTYTKMNESTLNLVNFGTFTIIKLDGNALEIAIKLQGHTSEIKLNATKVAEMSSSAKTDLLCRSWKITGVTDGDGKPVTPPYPITNVTVLFSKAGTYLVSYGDGETGLSSWKWKNEQQGTLYYSWETPPVWTDEYLVTITELTASSLKVKEMREDVRITSLVPYSAPRSKATLQSIQSTRGRSFFGF